MTEQELIACCEAFNRFYGNRKYWWDSKTGAAYRDAYAAGLSRGREEAGELAHALEFYRDISLDIFDFITKESSSVLDFNNDKFCQKAREALSNYKSKSGRGETGE